jgi:hypothetical protein
MPLSWNPPRAGIGIRHGKAARTGRIGIRTAVASRNDLRIAASREAPISLRDATHGAARIS